MLRRKLTFLVGAGALVMVTSSAVALRTIRRRRKRHILPRMLRSTVVEVLRMRGQDFIVDGSLGSSLFERRLKRLDDKQLIMLFALVQLGQLARRKGIDPLHPSAEQVISALETLAEARRKAPFTRGEVMEELRSQAPSSLKEALSVALGLLSQTA